MKGSDVPFEIPDDSLTKLFPEPDERRRLLESVEAAARANESIYRRLQGTGRFRTPAFEFTRRLRWQQQLRQLRAEEAAEVVHAALGEIFRQDKDDFLWEEVLGHNDTGGTTVDPFTDFLSCWESLGEEPRGELASVLEQVRSNPTESESFLNGRLSGVRWRSFREFLALAYQLQIQADEGTICLAVDALGRLFGVAPNQISRWRHLGTKYGYLEKVEEARPGWAAEFRFTPDPPDSR